MYPGCLEDIPTRQQNLDGAFRPPRCRAGVFSIGTHLVNDKDAIVQLLPLKERVKVLQQVKQVPLSVTVWNQDGHSLLG